MVDPVGSKANIERTVALTPVSATAPARAVQSAVQAPTEPGAVSTLQALAQPLAQSAPVDAERVAKIKKAIQDGNFPLVPSTIADRLLALKLQWNPNEKA